MEPPSALRSLRARRLAPLLVLLALAAAVALWRVRPDLPGPRLAGAEPVLRLPFPAGQVVLCMQGNLSPPGRTHSLVNNRFALDFSSAAEEVVVVVAAAPGRVVYALGGADPDDMNAEFQYGNHVKIDHGAGYFTLYAHLDAVDVAPGQEVASGTRIGTMGRTGAAGSRHLHFAMERGSPPGGGAHGSIPIHALVAADLAAGSTVSRIDGRQFVSGDARPWEGHLYGSENDPGRRALEGPAPPELASAFDTGRRRLAPMLARRVELARIARPILAEGPVAAEAKLRPLLAEDPDHPVAQYLLAAAVLGPRHQRGPARAALSRAIALNREPRHFEAWVEPRARSLLAKLDLEEGDERAAREELARALGRSAAPADVDAALARLRQHVAAPEPVAEEDGAGP